MLIGDRVGVLNEGRLEQSGGPEDCFTRPETRFVAVFLGEASFIPAEVKGKTAETILGPAQAITVNGVQGEADLLLRPDDLSISRSDASPNAQVIWSRFEGGSRLFAAKLKAGQEVRVRVTHEANFKPGESVQIQLAATHPLMAYKRGKQG